MDTLLLIKAAIMGIVEGLTEFLPVSSTGHLILTQALLGIPDSDVMKAFEVAIQPGAILAIFIVYWQLIRRTLGTLTTNANSRKLIINILVGFLPAAVIGFAIHKAITKYLFNAYGHRRRPSSAAGVLILVGPACRKAPKRADPSHRRDRRRSMRSRIGVVPGPVPAVPRLFEPLRLRRSSTAMLLGVERIRGRPNSASRWRFPR